MGYEATGDGWAPLDRGGCRGYGPGVCVADEQPAG